MNYFNRGAKPINSEQCAINIPLRGAAHCLGQGFYSQLHQLLHRLTDATHRQTQSVLAQLFLILQDLLITLSTFLSLLLLFAPCSMAGQFGEVELVVWRDLRINFGQVNQLSRALMGKPATIITTDGWSLDLL